MGRVLGDVGRSAPFDFGVPLGPFRVPLGRVGVWRVGVRWRLGSLLALRPGGVLVRRSGAELRLGPREVLMGWLGRSRSAQRVPEPEGEAREILAELAAVGISVSSLDELVNSRARYPEAIPILVRWLPVVQERRVRDVLISALGRPWAGLAALDALIAEFTAPADPTQLWHLGDAISYLWSDSRWDQLVAIATDPANGAAREMIVYGMRRSKRAETVPVLLELLDDRQVSGHATEALVALRDPRALPGLERMTQDDRAWVRKKARQGIARLATAGGTAAK